MTTTPTLRFEIYKAKDGWRWRLIEANHKTVAESGEAYASKWNAKRAVRSLTRGIKVVD
jgi:uncharacterized protein YegP (UPF0339 family)